MLSLLSSPFQTFYPELVMFGGACSFLEMP